ncbi:VWA domain-containing protein [Phototrophicus methaneseepsis]|uniref:VWA domain-containing protein n=1 Tax=Phototrophicus methaneseepsis TaxID=2710758 RepID=A0A7S8E688_9CHLR|nr:VWA domain-containing protein [Phototrophicus methaneseepsis]QPC81141.1 VWA domain-containing protein [Phototrophicus methaneseepsis]
MQFLSPLNLLFLAILPIVIVFMLWRDQVRRRVLKRLGNDELVQQLVAQTHPIRRRIQTILWFIAVMAIIFAAAQPAWGITTEIVQSSGVQVVFALDVSRSMDAQDMVPSRLERAVLDIQSIITEIEGNDIAIVLFAQDAVTYIPLTFDIDVIDTFLEQVNTQALTNQGTDIVAAINRAMLSFDMRTETERVLILMTDGENHQGNAHDAIQPLIEEGIHFYAVGYGTDEGGLIPIYNATGALVDYKTDSSGTLVETRLNSTLLQDMAELTDGSYLQPATGADVTELASVIQSLTPGELGPQILTRPADQSILFVLIAFIALSLEIVLPQIWGRR